jgi:hypothetical protein
MTGSADIAVSAATYARTANRSDLTMTRAAAYQALQGIQLGPHRLDVPGRHEAAALTDW